MTTLTVSSPRSWVVPSFGLAFGILAVATIVRLVALHFSVVDLFYDESQYWAWSREPAFGYVSKPPLLAWIIAIAEHTCGGSEACIRAPSPIFYFGASLVIYVIARALYDVQVAFYSAISFGLATGVAFSSRIISTDVPLMFFWALALLAYVKLVAGGTWRWAFVLGLSLGLGLLAKYAMIYFLLCVALAAWLEPETRRVLRMPGFWLALVLALFILAPNMIWNIDNGLVTFRRTGGTITGHGLEFGFSRVSEFIASQFGVIGPILFAVLLLAIARIASPAIRSADRLMLAFAIPPLALITVAGFFIRANANWAAPAFISGVIVAVALMVREGAWKWLAASILLGVIAQAVLPFGDAFATRLHLPFGANGDPYHRTLGWRSLGEQAGKLARRVGARTIVGDYRFDVASLMYYWRDQPEQILTWPHRSDPDNVFDLKRVLSDAAPMPILYVTECNETEPFASYFTEITPLGQFVTPTGPTTGRTYFAFKLDGPRKPIGPLGPCS